MVEFRKRFAEAQAAIPAEGMDRRAFDRLLRPLLAQVGDGHTTLFLPNPSKRTQGSASTTFAMSSGLI
jgi:hypothetical protein